MSEVLLFVLVGFVAVFVIGMISALLDEPGIDGILLFAGQVALVCLGVAGYALLGWIIVSVWRSM